MQDDRGLVSYRETSNICKTPAKITDRFLGFPQHFKASVATITTIRSQQLPPASSPLFINHPIIADYYNQIKRIDTFRCVNASIFTFSTMVQSPNARRTVLQQSSGLQLLTKFHSHLWKPGFRYFHTKPL